MNELNIQQEDDLSLGKAFRIILMQSKVILFIMALFVSFWLIYFLTADRVYRIESLLQVDSSNSLSSSLTQDFAGQDNESDINNLAIIYETRNNLYKVSTNLNLNLEEYKDPEGIQLQQLDLNNSLNTAQIDIYFFEDNYDLKIGEDIYIENIDYNTKYKSDYILSEIIKTKDNIDPSTISFKYISPSQYVKRLQSKINVAVVNQSNSFYGSRGGLLEISMNTNDVEKGIRIIDAANGFFIQNDINIKSQKASNAIKFIDERIESIGEILDKDKDKLNAFKEFNSTINVDLEVESIIAQLSNINSLINDIDVQKAKLSNQYKESNPLYTNLDNQRQVLINQKEEVESRIKKLPLSQQEYIDLFQNVEISQELYKELLNRRLTFSIAEASTNSNIRVIDDPYNASLVSPTFSSLLLVIFFSFFISIIFALIRGLNFMTISNPAEIEDNNVKIPILGIFSFHDEDLADEDIRFSQAVESAIVNLDSIELDDTKKIILITGPSKGVGKSKLSYELAKKYSDLGSKTILLDCDYKKGLQEKSFGVKKISQNDFDNISQEIDNYKHDENLYFIPRIKGLRNSFGLVNSQKFKNIIFNTLRPQFDIIIIDTPPLLAVSDTSALINYADINILVTRHNQTKIKEIKICEDNLNQINKQFDGVFYNAYERPKGYFGYYEYYGNYSYQYYADKYLYNYDDYSYKEDNES